MTVQKKYTAGTYIFRQGDYSDVAYMIVSGCVEIIKEKSEGSVRLNILVCGEIFGEMGLIDEKPRSATARAMDEVTVQVVDRNRFVQLFFEHPEDGIKFLRIYFERLRQLTSRIKIEDIRDDTPCENRRVEQVRFIPLTTELQTYVPEDGMIIKQFPFRIGRSAGENEKLTLDVNDLILEDEKPFNISRNHLSINKTRNGYVAADRGSFHGSIVNGKHIGGRRHVGQINLHPGKNSLVLGKKSSPFRFTVFVEEAEQAVAG